MKSLVIDTNIIVRFLIKDNEVQFEQALKIIESIENGKSLGYLSVLVLNELIWILERFYSIKRKVYISQILQLLSFPNIKIIEADKQTVITVLKEFQESSIDFTDVYLLHVLKSDKKFAVVSFDRDLRTS